MILTKPVIFKTQLPHVLHSSNCCPCHNHLTSDLLQVHLTVTGPLLQYDTEAKVRHPTP